MLLVFFSKEDPRLKVSVYPRRKPSLDPVDLGPLPVSKPFYTCFAEETIYVFKSALLKFTHEKMQPAFSYKKYCFELQC